METDCGGKPPGVNPMNEKLAEYLASNKDLLLTEWREQLVYDWNSSMIECSLSPSIKTMKIPSSASCSHQTADMLSLLARGFYEDLFSLLKGNSVKQIRREGLHFPRYTPYGVRMTPAHITGIFLAGEEGLGRHLLLNRYEDEEAIFTHDEAENAFEEIHGAFHQLALYYIELFCGDCKKPFLEHSIHAGSAKHGEIS